MAEEKEKKTRKTTRTNNTNTKNTTKKETKVEKKPTKTAKSTRNTKGTTSKVKKTNKKEEDLREEKIKKQSEIDKKYSVGIDLIIALLGLIILTAIVSFTFKISDKISQNTNVKENKGYITESYSKY